MPACGHSGPCDLGLPFIGRGRPEPPSPFTRCRTTGRAYRAWTGLGVPAPTYSPCPLGLRAHLPLLGGRQGGEPAGQAGTLRVPHPLPTLDWREAPADAPVLPCPPALLVLPVGSTFAHLARGQGLTLCQGVAVGLGRPRGPFMSQHLPGLERRDCWVGTAPAAPPSPQLHPCAGKGPQAWRLLRVVIARGLPGAPTGVQS